jgi:hypothetical protein
MSESKRSPRTSPDRPRATASRCAKQCRENQQQDMRSDERAGSPAKMLIQAGNGRCPITEV